MHNHNPVLHSRPATGELEDPVIGAGEQPQASHSMWWMVVCCAPMVPLALAILLGVFGPR